jgi:simple sugar transport system permease protein
MAVFAARIFGLTALIATSIVAITTNNSLMFVKKVPVLTVLLIGLLCLFTQLLLKTKLGQDFRSVGQNQHIAQSNGIDVNRTRIIAVIMSTVLAAWGQIIYLQNMGTLNTYGAHNQIGMFSVAALLVGGASVTKATVGQAILGTLLFNSMFIMSPEIGKVLFGQAILGEYFRTFMVYGVIGLALGLYVWNANRRSRITLDPEPVAQKTP